MVVKDDFGNNDFEPIVSDDIDLSPVELLGRDLFKPGRELVLRVAGVVVEVTANYHNGNRVYKTLHQADPNVLASIYDTFDEAVRSIDEERERLVTP